MRNVGSSLGICLALWLATGFACARAATAAEPTTPTVAAPLAKEPGHVLKLWNSIVASDDALRVAIDSSRRVLDIGILDLPWLEVMTEDDARLEYEMLVEESEEEGREPDYASFDEFVQFEGIEFGEEEMEEEWARLACSLQDVRTLLDDVPIEDGYRFECDDESEVCTLHGDEGSLTYTIVFQGSTPL